MVSGCAVRISYLLPHLNSRFRQPLHRPAAPSQFHVSEFAFVALLEAKRRQCHTQTQTTQRNTLLCRWPCVVAVFEPAQSTAPAPAAMPVPAPWIPLELDRKMEREKLRAYRCSECRRWRVRPVCLRGIYLSGRKDKVDRKTGKQNKR